MKRAVLALAAGGVLLAAACSTETADVIVQHFDRPTDLAYGCIGNRLDGDGGLIQGTTQALPLSECARSDEQTDAGVPLPVTVGFAVETTKSELVIASLVSGDVFDSDPLTPGHNGVTLGRLPVAADTTPDGCYTVVANAGSCDLSVVDVLKASLRQPGAAARTTIAATGGHIAAAPESLAMPPSLSGRADCPAAPVGRTYVAFPSCRAVAVLDLATSQVVSSVTFPDGGPAVIGGADLACPVDCGELATGAAVAPVTPGAEVSAIVMDPAGGRLYAAARNRSALAIIELDPAGDPVSVTEVPLEGAIGAKRLAVSRDVGIGDGDVSGTRRFAYVLALDNTVHVVDVTPGRTPVECDTQVDPRHLHEVTDVTRLACLAVGDAATPPRRVGATGPGIRLPAGSVPYDVAFIEGDTPVSDPMAPTAGDRRPFRLNGLFAVVTGRDQGNRGVAYVINVDDDNLRDFEDPANPGAVDLPLTLAHQLRDGLIERFHSPGVECSTDLILQNRFQGPVRLMDNPTLPSGLAFNINVSVGEDAYMPDTELAGFDPDIFDIDPARRVRIHPFLHLEMCEVREGAEDEPGAPNDAGNDRAVLMGSASATPAQREVAFPDIQRAPGETWVVTWEGPLAVAQIDSRHQGGLFETRPADLKLILRDGANRFCEMGVEERDIVQIVGCENDFQCALDEVCFVHPEAPSGVSGVCVHRSQTDELAEKCKPFFTSRRRYLVAPAPGSVKVGEVQLVLKPALLLSTPPDGCTSTDQCNALYNYEQDELEKSSGIAQPRDQTWTCRPDEALGGPSRCIATCPGNEDSECPTGTVCQDLVCVEGGFPPQECLASAQTYEPRAGGAFTVLGTTTGYLHDRVLDVQSGTCVEDAAASPLHVGRFHPVEPACAMDDDQKLLPTGPNPCSLTFSEPMTVIRQDRSVFPGTRQTRGILLRLPGMTLKIADVITLHPTLPGVLQASYPLGLVWTFVVGGGFTPRADVLGAGFPERVRPAPDGSLWVVDSGETVTQFGTAHGQLINFNQTGAVGSIQ